MQVAEYLALAGDTERQLERAFAQVAARHPLDPDVRSACPLFGGWSKQHATRLARVAQQYGEKRGAGPKRLRPVVASSGLFQTPPAAGMGLLRVLQDLHLVAGAVRDTLLLLRRAATALPDKTLEQACVEMVDETTRQIQWIKTRMSSAQQPTLVSA